MLSQGHVLPSSPMEMQAIAGCPLLPHVNVLPHGAIPAAEHRAESSNSQTHTCFGLRLCNHRRSQTLLTGQKYLPRTNCQNAGLLLTAYITAALPFFVLITGSLLSLSLCWVWQGIVASAHSWPHLHHLQTNAVLFWLKYC